MDLLGSRLAVTALLGAVLFLGTVPFRSPALGDVRRGAGIVAEDVRRKLHPPAARHDAARQASGEGPPLPLRAALSEGQATVAPSAADRARSPSEAAATSARTTSRPRS